MTQPFLPGSEKDRICKECRITPVQLERLLALPPTECRICVHLLKKHWREHSIFLRLMLGRVRGWLNHSPRNKNAHPLSKNQLLFVHQALQDQEGYKK